MIDQPGVYEIDAAVYRADPCAAPSLSSSVAKVILDRSPRHGWLMHPRLNPAAEPRRSRSFDLGSVAHALVLQSGDKVQVIDADSYRTKAAQEQRDAAHAGGRVPVLVGEWEAACTMAAAARAQLARHQDASDAFLAGRPEQTLIWQEGDVWCRARLDWLPAGGNVFYDYKSTAGSANPEHWGNRQLWDLGFDVQDAFYRRGIAAALGIDKPIFRFVVQENEPPYALSVIELTPAARDMADRKAEQAIGWWRWCMRTGKWPGYPARVAYVDPPPWAENRWIERENREQLIAETGEDLRKLMIEWQAPLKMEAHP